MKVRIRETPQETEIDGVMLDKFEPGTVRDVSPTLGIWLVVQGYAYPEMRSMDEEAIRPRWDDRRKR